MALKSRCWERKEKIKNTCCQIPLPAQMRSGASESERVSRVGNSCPLKTSFVILIYYYYFLISIISFRTATDFQSSYFLWCSVRGWPALLPGIQPAPWDWGRGSLSGGEGCTLFLPCSPASLPTPCCILPFIPSRRINLQFLFCLSPSPLLPVSHAQDLLLIYPDSFSFFHVFSEKKISLQVNGGGERLLEQS